MIEEFEKQWHKNDIPELRPGYTVRVQQKIREGGKERLQAFEGIIIKISSGSGVSKTITVRKVVDGIGVEKIFPIHSPNVAKIDITKKSKVRRAKLYYLRDMSRGNTKLSEVHTGEDSKHKSKPKSEAASKKEKVAKAA